MSERRIDMKAYRRNIKAACAAMGRSVPNGYTTDIAPNGDFIVRSNGEIFGRLTQWEKF